MIAFITSSGTLDKENPSVRKYISQRADFLGAIRLPNNTFDGAGAKMVVSDIIFLQKRDRIVERDEDWVHLGVDENGIRMNQYFIDNPDMVLGEMVMRSGQYGPEPTCRAYEDEDLGELLAEAVSNIHAEISEVEIEELSEDGEDKSIPADPTVKNFSFIYEPPLFCRKQLCMARATQTVCLGGSRKKRSEKKGDFHCLTFFTAPTLTLGDQKREVVAKVVIDGFVIILLAAELKEVEHRIHIRTDIYLNNQSGNRTFENARFIIKPPSQIFVLIFSCPKRSFSCASLTVKNWYTRPRLSVQPFLAERCIRSSSNPYSIFASVETDWYFSSVNKAFGTL